MFKQNFFHLVTLVLCSFVSLSGFAQAEQAVHVDTIFRTAVLPNTTFPDDVGKGLVFSSEETKNDEFTSNWKPEMNRVYTINGVSFYFFKDLSGFTWLSVNGQMIQHNTLKQAVNRARGIVLKQRRRQRRN